MHNERLRLVVLGVAYGISAVVYILLPAEAPTAFALPIELDWRTARILVVFFLPTAAACLSALHRHVASSDPFRANYARFRQTYDLILNAAVVFIMVLHLTLLAALLGGSRWIGHLPSVTMGLLFVIVGNVLPRLRPNLVVGIRTPWTLASERVWTRIHRIGGCAGVGLGLMVLVLEFLAPRYLARVMAIAVSLTAIAIVLASYGMWRSRSAQGEGMGSGEGGSEPCANERRPGDFRTDSDGKDGAH